MTLATPPQPADRMIWLDCLRLLAGLSMLGLHASSDFQGQPFAGFEQAERIGPVLVRSVLYIARTELFLITSIFLLMLALDRRPRSYRVMLAEQSRRLLLPFLFWTGFYAFWRLIKADAFGYRAALWADMGQFEGWLGYLLLGDVQYHMHFLPTLFGLALMAPLYRVAVAHPWVGLLVLLCLAIKQQVDLFLWANHQAIPAFDYVLRAAKILSYGGYGLVGAAFYGLCKQGFALGKGRRFGGVLLFVGGLFYLLKLLHSWQIITTGTWAYGFAPVFWADYLLPVILFLGVMSQGYRNWPAWLSRLAPYSFGIYLIHPAFMDLIEIAIRDAALNPAQMFATKALGALCGTVVGVAILARLPGVSWTIGLGAAPRLPRWQRPSPLT